MTAISELCTKCGLCCCILDAKCSHERAVEICDREGIPLLEFVDDAEHPNPHVRFPCKFLRGRPLRGVACAIYDSSRPEICDVYLCRLATQVKLGEIGLKDALSLLNTSFWRMDRSLFNWIGSDQEERLVIRESVQSIVANMIKSGIPEDRAYFDVVTTVMPSYQFDTEIDRGLMSMHLVNHDGRMELVRSNGAPSSELINSTLKLYFDEDDFLRSLTKRDRYIAFVTICAVFTDLRRFFVKTDPAWVLDSRRKNDEEESR